MTRDSHGYYPAIQLIEYSDEIILTDEEWNDTRFQQMIRAFVDCAILSHDIGSFEKEYDEQNRQLDRMYNVVAVIAQSNHCSIEEAIIKVNGMLTRLESDTLKLFSEYMSDTSVSESQKTFMDRVHYMMGGNHWYSSRLSRYNMMY